MNTSAAAATPIAAQGVPDCGSGTNIGHRRGLLQEHQADNSHVIVGRNRAVDHADDGQPSQSTVNRGGEHVQFRDKYPRWRHSDQMQSGPTPK